MKKYIFLFLLTWLSYPLAQACSLMGLYVSNPAPYFQIGGTMTDTFSVVVNGNTIGEDCTYFVTFDYGNSNAYTTRSVKMGSNSWPYQISSDVSGLKILRKKNDVTSCADAICGVLTGNSFYQTQSHNFTVLIDDTNDWRTAGVYQDLVTISLYEGTPSNSRFVTSRIQFLTAQSHKRADLSVLPSGGSFDINKTTHTVGFAGGLSTGAKGTADVVVKFNAGYSLYAWSDNGGKLKQVNGNDTIDYVFNINGTNYSIPYWTLISSQSGTSPVSGKVNPVTITIGNTTGKAEGTYTDTINLTIQSNQ